MKHYWGKELKQVLFDKKAALSVLSIHLAAILICTVFDRFGYAEDTAPMIFVLAVYLSAFVTRGYLWSIIGSVLAVFVVNYAFTRPFYALSFSGPGYPMTFITLFVVAILTSTITIRFRDEQQLRAESEKERTRANLLRAVSHDLRTPLTAISGAIDIVLQEQDTMPPEQQKEFLQGASEESRWLIRMVENLLTVTKLGDDGENRIITQPEAVEEVLAGAAAKFRRRYAEVPVEVSAPEELLMAPMDATLIQQVLLNLLEDAAQHGKGVKKIILCAEKKDDFALLRVEDDGLGIEPETLEHLFEGTMHRAQQAQSDRRNMGIGLTVCRTIVQAHGGTITGENRPEGGARFTITLPLSKEELS